MFGGKQGWFPSNHVKVVTQLTAEEEQRRSSSVTDSVLLENLSNLDSITASELAKAQHQPPPQSGDARNSPEPPTKPLVRKNSRNRLMGRK